MIIEFKDGILFFQDESYVLKLDVSRMKKEEQIFQIDGILRTYRARTLEKLGHFGSLGEKRSTFGT